MGEWIPTKDELRRKSKILPPDEGNKVTGYGRLYRLTNDNTSIIDVDVYNGSNWKITEMIIRVVAKKKDGSVKWIRNFKEDEVIPPLSTKVISIDTGDYDIASFEWEFEEIRGYKED